MRLKLVLNDANLALIMGLSRERWELFLLGRVRLSNPLHSNVAVHTARVYVVFEGCRLCQLQKCVELGLLLMDSEFFECPHHGSEKMCKFPEDVSGFYFGEIPDGDDLEVARIMGGELSF
jgi:hypothetical protein